MLRKTPSSIFVCLLFAFNLQAQTSKVDSSEMVTLRIDPDAARGAAVSQIFDEVKFIPLETTKESLFGSINQLRTTKDCYVIYDYDTKSVLIFNRDGKYRAKVNSTKVVADADEKDKQVFYGFNLIKNKDESLIRISSGKNYFFFDLDGKLVKKVAVGKRNTLDRYIKFADSLTTIAPYYVYKNGKDSTNYEVAILNDKKEVGLYFPFESDRFDKDQYMGGGNPVTDYGTDNELFYIRYYEYNLYKIKPKSVSLAYHIIFPASISIPQNFMDMTEYKKKRVEYFEKNPNQIYGISNPYLIGNNIYFKTNTLGWSQDKKNALVYNLKNGDLTSLKNLEPDTLSQFLPVTDGGSFYDFSNHGFHSYEDGYLYTSYSSLAMFSYKDLNAGKERKYDPILTKFFETQNKKSNPIIIQLKPKKN
ncbi:6-bladed beta-propeller [Pedobacter frigidisoli]|uniref:6-bladed beta-propeller n=1 Tax=Pedobacter frigidisoli TaxID=2530455 RepID=A0A4R0P6I2_9SPHI|nr:6-bladed beta-propeller [Pedobacter frigidisoli]TCD12549.1 6-bladed beta-propeller [Pedobacter frigidisoli]